MATANINYAAVWDTADKYLRNVVEEEDYGDYIIPLTVLRRLECVLAPTKDKVRATVSALKDKGYSDEMVAWEVDNIDGHDVGFYNSSEHSLESIAEVDDSTFVTLMEYVAGFSPNIRDIWDSFEFGDRMKKLDEAGRLWPVIKHFANLDMSEEALPNHQMGDLFEYVMYRAFNKKGKAAGNFYTPRDAIRLMVDILFTSDDIGLTSAGASRTVYDPTAGTGGMLLVADRALRELNPDIEVNMAGQEMMPMAHAIGKADLLIQGGDVEAIRRGNTLLEDLWEGEQFEYILSNPPFGVDWESEQSSVKEQAKVPGSRFSHGMPSKDDGQMLFLAHVASKLMPAGDNGSGGRGAVVSNGSPLFTGGPGSGPNSIRQWLLTSDLVDVVIQLPTEMFYGTGISTYIWILDTNKEEHRKGFVQLIDASKLSEPMARGMGFKRYELSEANRQTILEEYEGFSNTELSKVLTPDELGFRDIKVSKQARLRIEITSEVIDAALKVKNSVPEHADIISELGDCAFNDVPEAMKVAAARRGVKMPVGVIDAVLKNAGVPDGTADLSFDRRGKAVVDKQFSMTERIPLTEDVTEHMQREVLPYAPEVTWDEAKAKVGYEIPFKRLFYVPKPARPMEEIDADVAEVMGRLAAKFAEVRE